jgi:hypothetical protein
MNFQSGDAPAVLQSSTGMLRESAKAVDVVSSSLAMSRSRRQSRGTRLDETNPR